MTHAARPVKLLIAALLLLAVALAAAAARPAPSAATPATAGAAKLKKCKSGVNTKRCKCPKGKQLVKAGKKKYRCKKKKASQQQGGGQGNGNGNGNGTNTGTQQAPPAPPAGAEPQRDDAAFEAALSSTLLRRYEEGSVGYGRYAYNFLGDHQLLYCSYYYAGSTVEGNKVGTWQVEEGYTVPGYPGYTVGRVRITGADFDVRVAVEMYQDKSNVDTGNASDVFTKGAFTRFPGGAVTNCSAIS
jgi:hypothetical protein